MARPQEFDTDDAVRRATDLFWSDGFARTTPQRLTEALGIGRGSLYNTFGSKQELYQRSVEWYVEHETEHLIDHLGEEGSPLERIRTALHVVADLCAADVDGRGCLLTNAAVEAAGHDDAVSAVVRRTIARQERAFADAIRDGQRAGEIAADVDPEAAGASLVVTLNGLRALARVGAGSARDAARLHATVDHALRGL